MLIVPGARQGAPTAPWEIREAVELYARQHGRTGSIEFAVGPNVWVVKLSLRSNDKRMQLWQQGLAPEPPVETIWLQEANPNEGRVIPGRYHPNGQPMREGGYRALDIYQMGAAGVREFLERGNTWSGRGEFSSVEDALRRTHAKEEELRERFRERMREENRYERREDRRRYLEIPAVSVGIDLKNPKTEA